MSVTVKTAILNRENKRRSYDTKTIIEWAWVWCEESYFSYIAARIEAPAAEHHG